jgi:ferredoxin
MKVTVDPDRCQGHARCWDIAPEVFDLDEQGHGVVLTDTVPADLEAGTREAVANCPERALRIE